MIIMNPGEGFLRIYEHEIIGDGSCNMKRIKKIYHPSLKDVETNTVHTALSTKQSEILILVDRKDMYLFDLTGIDLEDSESTFYITKAKTEKDVYYSGI